MNKLTITDVREITQKALEDKLQEKTQKEYEAAWVVIQARAQMGSYTGVHYLEDNCRYTVNRVAWRLSAEGFKTKIEMANQANGVFRTHIIISWEE